KNHETRRVDTRLIFETRTTTVGYTTRPVSKCRVSKRRVSKRLVSKRRVSKRRVSKRRASKRRASKSQKKSIFITYPQNIPKNTSCRNRGSCSRALDNYWIIAITFGINFKNGIA